MTEALELIVDWAFSHSECRRITAIGVLQNNTGSRKVLEKNDFNPVLEKENTIDYISTGQK